MRKFEKVSYRDDAIIPVRSTTGSAGYDLISPDDFIIEPGEKQLIWLGIKAKMEPYDILMLFPRSSMGRLGVRFGNTVGIVDSDYYNNPNNEGEIALDFVNDGNLPWVVSRGDKVGQGIFTKYLVTDDDNVIAERTGGWGSTGK